MILSAIYRHSLVADMLQIGRETNTSHAERGQLDLAVNIYCRLYWTHTYQTKDYVFPSPPGIGNCVGVNIVPL